MSARGWFCGVAEEDFGEGFEARRDLSEPGFEREFEGDRCAGETLGGDSEMPCEEQATGLVKVVRDGDEGLEVEGIAGVLEGKEGACACVVGFQHFGGNVALDEGVAHGEGFVVFGAASISAEDDAAGFPCVVEGCGGIHTALEEGVGLEVPLFW